VLSRARRGPYVAPECRFTAENEGEALPPSTEQTDVWSAGACLHFALSGRPPEADATSPRASLPGAGEDLAAVVYRALAADPADRYESAYAMLGDVRRLIAGRRPKLDGAHAPVPSYSFARSTSLPPPAGPASSSDLHVVDGGASAEDDAKPAAGGEWRGNVVLFVAIALLVGLATFVLVRERLADERTAPPSSAETR
jgi:serine/threonine protein kinase